jgi:hypothetical protein
MPGPYPWLLFNEQLLIILWLLYYLLPLLLEELREEDPEDDPEDEPEEELPLLKLPEELLRAGAEYELPEEAGAELLRAGVL